MRSYKSVPLVQRLEYLIAFLNSYDETGSFDEEKAFRAVQKTMHAYQIEKAKAFGRQQPRLREGKGTFVKVISLAKQLGFIDTSKQRSPDAALVLDSDSRRQVLIARMWQAYPRFRKVLLVLRDNGMLNLPDYAVGKAFGQEAGPKYGFEFSRAAFVPVRDLATDLGLVNWYPIEHNRQIVYPTACICLVSELHTLTSIETNAYQQQCISETARNFGVRHSEPSLDSPGEPDSVSEVGYLQLKVGLDTLLVRDHSVTVEEFEQALWDQYLKLTDMRPRHPVLYPDLRNRVCNACLITDAAFDQHVLSLIQRPQRLDIFPSGGVLNFEAKMADLTKFLPPQTSQGRFIIYLKIDRRQ